MNDNPVKYYLMMIVTTFFWGGSWVSADIIVEIAPPMVIGFLRFFVALIPFVILLRLWRMNLIQTLRGGNLRILFLVGLTGVFGYGVFFLVGMSYTTSAQGAIIAGMNPATISIFARIIHGERLSRNWQYLGFVLSFLGVIFVIGVQALVEFRLDYLIGNLLIVAAMVTWGLYSSVGKTAMKTISAAETTTGGVLFGMMLFGLASVTEEWAFSFLTDAVFWINILFLGILVTFVGFLFFFVSVKNLGATKTGVFINLVPVFGTLMSVLVLNETMPWTFVTGLLLIVIGITVINIPVRRQESAGGHSESVTTSPSEIG